MRLTQRLYRTAHLVRRATIPAGMKMLADAGLSIKSQADGTEIVADRFLYCPAIGWWREIDGSQRGFSPRTLISAAKA